ncbi:MAG: hypothetical protein ACFB12_09385 [Leptolyngbyaceae cyanobacterium]
MELFYFNTFPELAAIGLPLSVVLLLLLHCLMGLLAAQLADRKGADLGKWLIWGMIGGTGALVTALRLPTQSTKK